MYILNIQLELSISQSDLTVALAAIYWSAFTGLERYFGFLTALGTYCGEHLTSEPVAVAITSVTGCLSGFAAGGATLGLVSIAFRLVKLLFFSTEGEGCATIGTLETFVLKTHVTPKELVKLMEDLIAGKMKGKGMISK